MAGTERRYSKEEFARRGDAIHEKEVRPQLKASDKDKFAAIDIESGEFAIDADELKACHKLRKRIPDRADLDGARWLSVCASHRRSRKGTKSNAKCPAVCQPETQWYRGTQCLFSLKRLGK